MPASFPHPVLRVLALTAALAAILGWPTATPASQLPQALALVGAQDAEEEDAWPDDSDDADVADEDGDADAFTEEDLEDEDVGEEALGDEDPEDEDAVDAGEDAFPDDDVEYVEDFEDDSWASAWDLDDENAADDAIQIDDSLFDDDDQVWEVFDEDEDDDERIDEDSIGIGDITTVRTSRKAAGTPKPPRLPGDDDDTVYAFGGRPVSALSVPWQAQILYPGAPAKPNDTRPAWQRQHYCGGALIAPDWVLTAAHCIDQQMVDLGFKVRLGVQDISRPGGKTYRIDRIVRHSQYNAESNDVDRPPNMYANDIALIRIVPEGQSTAPIANPIRQIAVNQQALPPGVPVSATGWGVTGSENANAINAVMLRVDLQVMPNPVCQQRPGYSAKKIKGTVFCASNPGQSTCRGDSGGPVVLTNGSPTLVGIVSWGKRRCAGDGRPGVYTRIDQYAQWISQAMSLPPGRSSLP